MAMQQLKNELSTLVEFDDFSTVLKSMASVKYPKARNSLNGFREFGKAARENLLLAFSYISPNDVTLDKFKDELKNYDNVSNKLEIEEGLKQYGLETFFNSSDSKHSLVIIITSNMGFCGKYNRDVIFLAEELIEDISKRNKVKIITIGKKAGEYFTFKGLIPSENKFLFPEKNEQERVQIANNVLKNIILEPFLKKEISEVFVVYDKYDDYSKPPHIITGPEKVQLLPLPSIPANKSDHMNRNMVFEPSPLICLSYLIREYLFSLLMSYFVEAETSENYMRMIAMNQASEAIKEAIEKKESEIRKTRQTQITKELVEIISGAEALKNRAK